MSLEAIKYKRGKLEILDQLALPRASVYIPVESVDDAWRVINRMHVRGAPAIAIVGALSLAVELTSMTFCSVNELRNHVHEKLDYLVSARPTAVNMATASLNLKRFLATVSQSACDDIASLKAQLIVEIESMLSADVAVNQSIGQHGADAILVGRSGSVTILTHCNTGSLATAGYGTALGVVRCLHSRGRLGTTYFTETRPFLQGARLTAFELASERIPAVIVCDSAAAALMAQRGDCARSRIDAVVVGADRVAANGDTANKIGTYQLAVAAAYHGVPFYVAAPRSSIDTSVPSGDAIVVEERPAHEVLGSAETCVWPDWMVRGERAVGVWNPSFDVTPAALITGGIITERGVLPVDEIKNL